MRGWLLLLLALSTLRIQADDTGALAVVRARFCDFQLARLVDGAGNPYAIQEDGDTERALRTADRTLGQQRPDGSWPDIDYTDGNRSGWPAAQHAGRLLSLAQAWRLMETGSPQRARCLAGAQRAFAYWRTNDFQCPNWWYNQIGVPRLLAPAALLLADALPDADRAYMTKVVRPRCRTAMTGQNRVWLAGNTLMIALLASDEASAAEAARAIWSELRISTDEGIQPDFSFHQHGPQLQFGNYGLAFAGDMTRWLTMLDGTPFQPDATVRHVLAGYLDEGLAWTLWRGRMDASCIGRQFGPNALASRGQNIATIRTSLRQLGSGTAQPAPFGEKIFWRSDFVVHRRPGLMATLKMCSRRTIGAELVNSENLLGHYAGDGVLLLQGAGGEYEDIFPLWNWRRLPGITAPQSDAPPSRFSNSRLPTVFTGGVTDGTNGCATLDLARDGVVAKKSWFFAGDQVFCLGAGIASTGTLPLATGVNQCWLRGAVGREDGQLVHDGFRYAPLAGTRFEMAAGAVTGSWRSIAHRHGLSAAAVTGSVFSVWIDHGVKPVGASYAYAILPTEIRSPGWQILANTTNLQAIASPRGELMAVFHAAGDLRFEHHALTVDEPCLVHVSFRDRTLVTIADPSQRLPLAGLSWDGHFARVSLPKGPEAGRSVTKAW